MHTKTLFIARAAMIACLYTVLTLAVAPIAYGPVQFRISEMLTILPLFYLEAIPGLAIGCLLANVLNGPWDMLLGTLATLAAAILTRLLKKIYLGVLPPIVLNAFIVPVIFLLIGWDEYIYIVNVLLIAASQTAVIGTLGVGLYFALRPAVKKIPALKPVTLKELFPKKKPAAQS